jgi:Uma2 family endonuclease
MPHEPELTASPQGDQRIVIRDVGWHVYQCLSEAIGEEQHVRLAYDGKDMELMTTGYIHERTKGHLSTLVSVVCLAHQIDYEDVGEATLEKIGVERALQADLSYLFDGDKLRITREMFARGSKDWPAYPKPDLSIEIDLSHSEIDRALIYATLEVTEVWRFNGVRLAIDQLQPDGSHATSESSRFLPIRGEDVTRWLVAEDPSSRLSWQRRLTQWAQELAAHPR